MSSFVGGPLDTSILNQIQLRENILAREGIDAENYLRFKTGNTAWIRVISGVDIESKIENTPPPGVPGPVQKESIYSSNEAKNFVLSGGSLVWDGTKFLKRDSFNTTNAVSERGRYNYTQAFGIRPEGGITGFNIKHKNPFGTVREATISFTVWSKEDLESAENLYFRPGMTLITEWGNTSYFTNDSKYEDVVTTSGVKDFFKAGQTVSQKNILDILRNNVLDSNHNYDAFYGFVSNFSWSLREDGGFDCTLTVLSRGTILDSLSVIKGNSPLNGPFNSIPEKFFSKAEPPEDSEENGLTYSDTTLEATQRVSLLHFFCYKLEEIDIEDLDEGIVTFDNFKSPVYRTLGVNKNVKAVESDGYFRTKTELNPVAGYIKKQFDDQGVLLSDSKMIAAGFNGKVSGDGKTAFRYISLRTFLALVNLTFLNGEDQNLPKFSLTSPKKYKTFANHFSFDPSSVLLPKFPTQPELKASRRALRLLSEIGDEDSLRQGAAQRTLDRQQDKEPYVKALLNNTSDNIQKASEVRTPTTEINRETSTPVERNPFFTAQQDNTRVQQQSPDILTQDEVLAQYDHILNIHISTKLIKENLDLIFSKSTSELDTLNVMSFIRNILKNIQSSLGGINEFDVHYNEIDDKFSIIDRAAISIDGVDYNKVALNISGLKNTVKTVNMETKIGSNLASMISISATSGTEGDPNNNPALEEYNKGKRDRFKNNYKSVDPNENNSDPVTPESKEEEEKTKKEEAKDKREKREQFFRNLRGAYTLFNNMRKHDFRIRGVYKEKLFDKLKGEKITRTKEAVAKELKAKNRAPAGIIPIELTLTMNGISGLVVGQAFKLKGDFLPSIYDGTGFVITSLDATIENNKWLSTIKAQTFLFNTGETTTTVKGTGEY